MNQGKLDVVKQEMSRVNINILGKSILVSWERVAKKRHSEKDHLGTLHEQKIKFYYIKLLLFLCFLLW